MAPLLILFINLGVGGVQRKIVDIVNFLGSYQPDLPIFILLRNREQFDLTPDIRNKKVKTINYKDYKDWMRVKIPLFFPFFVLWHIWRLKPKSILAFLDFVSLPAIWAKLILFWRKTKLVLSEDHYTSRIIPIFTYGRLRNFLVKMFYPFADVVFTCSQATKNDLIRNYGLPENKIKIIRNWTTFTTRRPKIRRKKYDFIYLGRLEKTKNLGFLIKALKKLKETRKGVSLCLLGSGKEKESLERMTKESHLEKNVDFIEPRRDVEDFLAQSRIFVYSPQIKAEGFPLAILEAMAVGTPVLTRDFAGAKEFLADGKNCYFFQTQKEFIQKALWLLNNPSERRRIASRARWYVEKYHSPQNILEYLKELELLKEEDK
ncbi:MAG TPA: glycosyltransferase family 4 protein [Nevskiaceae bacterium]|nr:glycosyltransferase family 4 protein [Nevskiaceae bacterium]